MLPPLKFLLLSEPVSVVGNGVVQKALMERLLQAAGQPQVAPEWELVEQGQSIAEICAAAPGVLHVGLRRGLSWRNPPAVWPTNFFEIVIDDGVWVTENAQRHRPAPTLVLRAAYARTPVIASAITLPFVALPTTVLTPTPPRDGVRPVVVVLGYYDLTLEQPLRALAKACTQAGLPLFLSTTRRVGLRAEQVLARLLPSLEIAAHYLFVRRQADAQIAAIEARPDDYWVQRWLAKLMPPRRAVVPDPANPWPQWLAAAQLLVVTPDSISCLMDGLQHGAKTLLLDHPMRVAEEYPWATACAEYFLGQDQVRLFRPATFPETGWQPPPLPDEWPALAQAMVRHIHTHWAQASRPMAAMARGAKLGARTNG